MTRLPALFHLVCLACTLSGAQPLAGSYTVGGTNPDFATPQAAANALKQRGVAGPVFINIRPGTYMREGSPGPVIRLDTVVAGTSSSHRITFQPDVASGGNPANVLLLVDCEVSTNYNADREIVYIGADYLTFRNLTFKDADSMDTPSRYLFRVDPVTFWNPTIEDLVIDGCTFVGSPYYLQGGQFGTDLGVFAGGGLSSARVTNCHFSNLMRAISLDNESAPAGDSLFAEDNRFDHLYGGFTGSGNPLGTATEMVCAHPSVRRNIVSQSSGSGGLIIIHPVAGIIEDNYIQGDFRNGQIVARPRSGVQDRTDSLMIRNNITMGNGAMEIRTGHTWILHNTIIHYGSFGSSGLWISGTQCTMIDNILLAYGGGMMFSQNGSAGLVSDHNVFFSTCVYFARDGNGEYYFSLASYSAATGLDSNSHVSDVSFNTDSLGIHLEECEAQKSVLTGVPLPQVRADYYGALRDSLKPFVGAVEGKRLPYDMFADVRKFALPGAGFGAAAGDLNGDGRPELAVTDYSNSSVLLYHNGGANRSFTQNQALFPEFAPTLLRFFDLDHDTNLDLIVAGEANAVKIYWGNGSGSFSSDLTVNTTWHPTSIDTGMVSFYGFRTILLTEDNGFLPNRSLLCFLFNGNGRNITEGTITTPGPLGGSYPDTLNSVLGDFVATDIDGNGSQEVVALSIGFPPLVYFFADTAIGNLPWGHHDSGYFGTGAYLGMTSSISSGDFDGDQRPDILTTGASENKCILLRNQGNRQFVADTIPATASRGLAVFDYEHDGDLDFVTANRTLDSLGVTVYLNDGTGHFSERRNCYYPYASGNPLCIVPADYDGDGKTDLAITTFDSLFVLYNLGGFNGTTAITERVPQETPQGFALLQNYPNPFNPATHIDFVLSAESKVSITIYNMLGQEVVTLLNEGQFEGHHSIEWNGRSARGTPVSSGVYFYRLEMTPRNGSNRFVNVKKMLLLK